jgi:diguanylate cyclase (GGDEF)-like protein/PAS domain S-box-containing protein
LHITITPHIVPFAGAAVVLFLLLNVAWNNRRDPVARWFAATLVAAILWAIGYCLEITATTVPTKVFYANIEYIGVAAISPCWWELIRRYLEIRRIPKLLTAAIWILSAATVLVAFTNPGHIFRGTPVIVTGSTPFPVLHADYQLWYHWVVLPMTTLLDFACLALLTRAAIRARGAHRRLYVLLFASFAVPLVGVIYYVSGLPPWTDYNLTPALCGVSGILMGVGLFRWRLFNIVPLAHDRVVEDLRDGVMVLDGTNRIIDMNHAAEAVTGLRRREVFGRHVQEALAGHPALERLLTQQSGQTTSTPPYDIAIDRDGVRSFFTVSSSEITSRKGGIFGSTVVFHDVTERRRLFEQVRELANKDDLTELSNRRHFLELAAKELDRAKRYDKPLSLFLFDVDHFKRVNDNYGHRAGDRVLREIAQVCIQTLRSTDIIGRMGGEEFAVLLPETNLPLAADAAERLRIAIKGALAGCGDGGRGPITISAGVAELQNGRRGTWETIDSAYERADRALYEAKGSGRDIVVTSDEKPGLRVVV